MRALLQSFILLVATSVAGAATIQENFASDPALRGWMKFGESNLFTWNASNQNLAVTWDSSKTNSYFHRPLGTILARDDDFAIEFDLWLDDIDYGTTPGKPYTFQIAVSLFNLVAATRSNLFAGTGANASTGLRSAVEFNYFPDSGYGATFSCIAVSTNTTNLSQFRYGHDFPTEFDPGVWHHLALAYTASNQTLALVKTREGLPYGITNRVRLDTLINSQLFTDFRLDTVAIASYSDAGVSGSFAGSVLAHGVVDNLVVTVPDHPAARPSVTWSNGVTSVGFESRTNWQFTLARSTNLVIWDALPGTTNGNGAWVEMTDANASAGAAFYHVKGTRP
jgi:hypothetical protein